MAVLLGRGNETRTIMETFTKFWKPACSHDAIKFEMKEYWTDEGGKWCHAYAGMC